MREILFKAKRINNGEWVVGQYVNTCYPGKDKETGHFIVVYPNKYHEIYTSTLCQFTGLCDKNGNKIWENDIFKFNDEVWESSYTSCGMEYDSWEVENYGVVGYYKKTARYDFADTNTTKIQWKLNCTKITILNLPIL